MGKKARAAKASLVAAFVAAGGAAATAEAHEATRAPQAAATRSSSSLNWGSQLVRFLKLEGFPAYLKIEGFAQYNKLLSLPELSDFYNKDRTQIDAVLALYQKGGNGKFESFSRSLQADAKNAFEFFQKETGIVRLPAVQFDGEIG